MFLLFSMHWNRPAAEVKEEDTPDENNEPAAEVLSFEVKEEVISDEKNKPAAKVLSYEVKEEATPDDAIGVELHSSLANPVLPLILW